MSIFTKLVVHDHETLTVRGRTLSCLVEPAGMEPLWGNQIVAWDKISSLNETAKFKFLLVGAVNKHNISKYDLQ